MDIRTIIQDGRGRWTVTAPGLSEESGLDSAVIISLFTDRRAEADDLLPDGSSDLGGWWADAFPDIPGDKIGSRLWLLRRAKLTDETLRQLEEYASEALQWLLTDGVVVGLAVVAERLARTAAGVVITMQRPQQGPLQYRFTQYWEG